MGEICIFHLINSEHWSKISDFSSYQCINYSLSYKMLTKSGGHLFHAFPAVIPSTVDSFILTKVDRLHLSFIYKQEVHGWWQKSQFSPFGCRVNQATHFLWRIWASLLVNLTLNLACLISFALFQSMNFQWMIFKDHISKVWHILYNTLCIPHSNRGNRGNYVLWDIEVLLHL